ncbi:hypothetical protein GGD66_006453 [Bradyrhizobium sp. CIR48]|uniref:hypothetical protein n=1 Tax=Bradyrhizobium sp. CIR48 TaxID=2663840 RepID=UPI001605BF35|nr:hypothetical protein [Bradyrhizobium sp. CIR48]MBB4427870.1 hypothetical protein [Bradyrhizobium sp. CIR48]
MSFLDEIDEEVRHAGLDRAVGLADTPPIFDWLVTTFSFQGISDRVARDYIHRHGTASWSAIAANEMNPSACPKLRSYWHFEGCRYDKTSFTCAEPDHIDACPLPRPHLRNGRLNQTAYSLFLFVRDLANDDLVGWIDSQLDGARGTTRAELEAARQEALIGPLRNVYGVSDKILMMTLSTLLIGAREHRSLWLETGTAMIAVDTLVHNFLHRTGILQDCDSSHAYGAACYRPGGCAEIIRTLAGRIDARTLNPVFPKRFARFVQNAIWRFCSGDCLNLCNGNRIDDRHACQIGYCHLHQRCDRIPLKKAKIDVKTVT